MASSAADHNQPAYVVDVAVSGNCQATPSTDRHLNRGVMVDGEI